MPDYKIYTSNQEILNDVIPVMAAQGWQRSFDAYEDTCAYRGDRGFKCALGAVIPDELYTPVIEGVVPVIEEEHLGDRYDQVKVLLGILKQIGITDYLFIRNLQSAHDNSHHQNNMRRKMMEVAADFNLQWPEGY